MGICYSLMKERPRPKSRGFSDQDSSRTSSTFTTTTATSAANTSSSSIGQYSANSLGAEAGRSQGMILESPDLRIYTYAELRAVTRNFRPETLIGEGGFGKVFKGWVNERTLSPARSRTGMVVAVKKISPESMQGLEEWQSEVNFLGRLSHPNLVRLLGYCWEDTELLLVYEFMTRGSLENQLFRTGPVLPLGWSLRMKILIGAARGLAFLHASDKQVIYRDFKASNILLDSNYNAKISDFGLAKNGPTGGDSHVTTRIMGTYGYAAPEYVATGHLYVKSDVYGFGVVLLEMLTGKRAIDTRRPRGQHQLVEWAKPHLHDRRTLAQIMDRRMDGQYSTKAAVRAAQLTLRCLAAEPKSRPSMAEVADALEHIEAIKGIALRKPKPLPGSGGGGAARRSPLER